jgi:hypothetical protein
MLRLLFVRSIFRTQLTQNVNNLGYKVTLLTVNSARNVSVVSNIKARYALPLDLVNY